MLLEKCFRYLKFIERINVCHHPEKSILIPSQEFVFLGFAISSKKMTVTFTDEKKIEIKTLMTHYQNKNVISLTELPKIIENTVVSVSSVTNKPLLYRDLERDKRLGFKHHRDHFDRKLVSSANDVCDIQWWTNNIDTLCYRIAKT